ncbi:hypothetical protein TrRE_jg1965, partial [Triparma retinervis]
MLRMSEDAVEVVIEEVAYLNSRVSLTLHFAPSGASYTSLSPLPPGTLHFTAPLFGSVVHRRFGPSGVKFGVREVYRLSSSSSRAIVSYGGNGEGF